MGTEYRKYELLALGTGGLAIAAFAHKLLPTAHNIPVTGFVAMGIFLFLTRYVSDPSDRANKILGGTAAVLALAILSAAQVLFLQDLHMTAPVAAVVNLGLSGLFVSTVLYLYLIGAGLSVIDNYAMRFNKNYKVTRRPLLVYSLLLFVYALSASKHLLTLYMLRIMR